MKLHSTTLLFLLSVSLFSSASDNFYFNDSSFTPDNTLIIIKEINITGNKTTKNSIILRELMFKKWDTISLSLLSELNERSRQNLLNTSLFNFVTITAKFHDSIYTSINIEVLERWYVWPIPRIDLSFRNFNSWWETKDLQRFNYGFSFVYNNFRGRKEILNLLLLYGYNEKYLFSYLIPYINSGKTLGLGFSFGLNHDKEVSYNTENNKPVYHKNYDSYPLKRMFINSHFSFRQGVYNTHICGLQFSSYNFNDSILSLNPNFSFSNDKPNFFTFHYKFKNDFRDNKSYPLKGHYFDADIYKFGFPNDAKNPDIFVIHSSYNMHFKISRKYYFSAGFIGSFSDKKTQPYYLTSGIGYGHDNIRGFDYYVINGKYFGISKLNLKYELLSPKIYNFTFIPTEKFSKIHYSIYLNLFSDSGYAYDDNYFDGNDLANQFLFSLGIGIDFVTYYDKVVRFEYTFNKMKESGLFINFIAPI